MLRLNLEAITKFLENMSIKLLKILRLMNGLVMEDIGAKIIVGKLLI